MYDSLNRLLTQEGGGRLQLSGTVSEPATVAVSGVAAAVTEANTFNASVPVGAGPNVLAITATDPSGNAATATYQVDVATGASKALEYDANGNLISDGTRSFEWDARNQLSAVQIGDDRSEFSYDALGRLVRAVEKQNGFTVRDGRIIWEGPRIAEERLSTGDITRVFMNAEQQGGSARFLTRDHLASIRDVTDSLGALTTRNTYDPFGRTTRVAGNEESLFGYTGFLSHNPTGLLLAMFRAYDPVLGRWLSEDPLGFADGPNAHAYVRNRPISWRDSEGTIAILAVLAAPAAADALATAAAWTLVTLAALAAGEAVAKEVMSRSEKEAQDEATRYDKFAEIERRLGEKKVRQNRRDYPREDRPEDIAEDLAHTRDGSRRGGRDQVDSTRKTDDRIRHRPNDPDRRCDGNDKP